MNKYGYEIDQVSYELGHIGCYSEMVGAKVEPIAFSHPIAREHLDIVERAVKQLTGSYGIHYYIDEYSDREVVFALYTDKADLDKYLAAK